MPASMCYDNQRSIIEILHKKTALRPASMPPAPRTFLWALNRPDLYWLLAGERGGTPDQHEAGLADLLCQQILTSTEDAAPQ